MSNLPYEFAERLNNIIKIRKLNKKFVQYKNLMQEDHPFKNFPMKNIGDCSGDPMEFFSHYDAYSYWLADKLHRMGNGKKILDVGNRKVTNAMLSVNNDVTALVLMDCEDSISKVNYVVHDISEPLPFDDNSFDVFTSSASLHLVGLGRYGDKLNPDTLLNFIKELDRVLKPESDLIFSIDIGPNGLLFNIGWAFDIETIKKLFNKWELYDYLTDNHSIDFPKPYKIRFIKDLNVDDYEMGEYRVTFLHFKRYK